eukprot:CAMPEP_0183510458 /NCGR_PEP_ID=MMETSP0371-20130417/10333_1 /TAXON_ID=268820 /ORGANISM="Peridinium aciculiferum, Strain PAER-2" /LENGTH=507 /DNA_ID=CAMNT_0025707283 /DNA_START=65 /DNA_END=1588 /DNA_ORIENTATION=-
MSSGGEPSHFVNAVSNPARHTKSNRATLDMVCAAAYQGDMKALEVLLKSGDEDNIFNGDLNMHFTDVSALHMAAMAGNADCVKLLLEAKADPHLRTVVSDGKDPQTGEKPQDKAKKFEHNNIADILRKAEESTPPGRYQPDGISNNKKLYGDRQPSAVPKEVKVEAPVAKPAAAAAAPAAAAPAAAAPAGGAQKPSMPVALLFPGQGSQYVKMLDGVKDLPEVKDMLEKAKEVLGFDLLELCLQGPEDKLSQTKYCQPAMFVGGLAGIAKLRKEKGDVADRPQCVAGLSLGEYTALCAAGVLSFEDGLKLVKLRGEAMQEAAQASKQGMVSVVGLERGVMDKLCEEAAKKAGNGEVAKVANVLFPKGFSCAGTEKAVNLLRDMSEKKGALQAKLLKTSGGFHTSLMQPAQEKLKKALDEVLPNMKPPTCAVYMNVTGEPLPAGSDPKTIVELLNKQLVSPVLWHNSVERMMKDGVTEFYECGPQKQIKAMMKRIDNKVWSNTTSMEV